MSSSKRLTGVLLLVAFAVACQPDAPAVETGGSAVAAAPSDLTRIEGLGAISFPNSGASAAQAPFVRGVLLLHSFEYG